IAPTGLNKRTRCAAAGGTRVTRGNACDLAIEKLPIPVKNLKKGFTRDQHFGPGAILRVEVDTQHPIGYGAAPNTYGFYVNSPFFSIVEEHRAQTHATFPRLFNAPYLAARDGSAPARPS